MITVRIGDIFESEAQTLVNTINCAGVMGKGIAADFKVRFPDMFEDYVKQCREGRVELGKPYLYQRLTPPWILNFPTKDHWRSVSRLDNIVAGMQYLQSHYREWGVSSLAAGPSSRAKQLHREAEDSSIRESRRKRRTGVDPGASTLITLHRDPSTRRVFHSSLPRKS